MLIRLISFRFIFMACLLTVCTWGTTAEAMFKDKKPDPLKPSEFIVKFSTNLTQSAQDLISKRQSFRSALADGDSSLDELNNRVKVRAARHLFTDGPSDQNPSEIKKNRGARVNAIKAKFAKRAKRAPKSAAMPDLSNIYVMSVPPGSDIDEIVQLYRANPNVVYAQPNYQVEVQSVPNDPYYSSSNSWGQGYGDLWGLKKIKTEQAWDKTKGVGTIVAVVDTGLDTVHPDIAANVWTNAKEIPNNHIDDDGNGYIDDVNGWNFTMFNNDVTDRFGHGTHVSGTIAAVGNNIGVIGVAPEAKIMPLKAMNDNGSGFLDQLARAIVYAAENGADVINNSWGCSYSCPSNPLVEDAIRTANAMGAVTVFASGNSGTSVSLISPQNMIDPKPIVVAATDPEDAPVFFSNIGLLVDVAAPGAGTLTAAANSLRGILSLKSKDCDSSNPYGMCPSSLWVGNNYLRQTGTSMAAPHVSGLAALILANHPAFTPEEVRQVLRVSSDDVYTAGFDIKTGAGRVNATAALDVASVLQLKIKTPSVTSPIPVGSAIVVTGTAAGPGFTDYQLFYMRDDGLGQWVAVGPPVFSPVQDGELGRLTAGANLVGSYYLRLTAHSSTGKTFNSFAQFFVEPPLTKLATSSWDYIPHDAPAISGNNIAHVVQGDTPTMANVFVYDLVARTNRPITAGDGDKSQVSISGDKIVWVDFGTVGPSAYKGEIYLYDLKMSTTRKITNGSWDKQNPRISGDKIVWQDFRNGHWDIYSYDLTANQETRITTRTSDAIQPVIDGNVIAWFDNRNGTTTDHVTATAWDVFMYDLSTGIEKRVSAKSFSFTTEMYYTKNISISKNRIVWSSLAFNPMENCNIFLYDIADGSLRLITNNSLLHTFPRISGDRVVYMELSSGQNYNILLLDLTNNTTRQITGHPAGQHQPDIWGSRLVWMDFRNANSFDLYYRDELGTVSLNGPSVPVQVVQIQTAAAKWEITGLPLANDRIGLFSNSADNSSPSAWVYLSCTKATPGGVPPASGQCALEIPNTLVSGTYEFRYLTNDSLISMAKSAPFQLDSPWQTHLNVSPGSVSMGGLSTVSWSNIISPSSTDWIGLYSKGAADTNHYYWLYVSCSQNPNIAQDAGSCNVSIPPTVGLGEYEFRMFANNGYTKLATSLPFAVMPILPPMISTSLSSANPGGTSTVSWSNIANPSPTDWIGLYSRGAIDTNHSHWVYVSCSQSAVTAKALGSCAVTIPSSVAPGQYEFRLFANNGYTKLATSAPITVTQTILSAFPASVNAGEATTVFWSNIGNPSARDWVGLYSKGAEDTNHYQWIYVGCSQKATTTAPSGACAVSIPPSTAAGQYEFRLFSNDGYTKLATSAPFVVKPLSPTIGGFPASINAGGTSSISWSNIANPSPTDWIALYGNGAVDTSNYQWMYVSCSQSSTTAKAAGSCSVTISASTVPGRYEFRLFSNNGYTKLATSASFTVTSP